MLPQRNWWQSQIAVWNVPILPVIVAEIDFGQIPRIVFYKRRFYRSSCQGGKDITPVVNVEESYPIPANQPALTRQEFTEKVFSMLNLAKRSSCSQALLPSGKRWHVK